MNKMKEVAALLGVELNEEFKVDCTTMDGDKYTMHFILQEDGLYSECGLVDQLWLIDMLTGKVQAKKLPYKPKHGEAYWTVNIGFDKKIKAQESCWLAGHIHEYLLYYNGLCFRTKEEAEKNKDKLLKIIEYYEEN